MTHILKLREEFAGAVLEGDKNFEIRFNDRGYQKGDYICFQTVDKSNMRTYYPEIEKRRYQITYVISGWGVQNGYVVFGIKEAADE